MSIDLSGELIGIATRIASNSPMISSDTGVISEQKGLRGDFRGDLDKNMSKNRQVTVLSQESWNDAEQQLQLSLDWTLRRANLFVSGVRFSPQDVGKKICIGDAELLISRETDPCSKMDLAQPGLMQALVPDWRGGVCTRVIKGGNIAIGDKVHIKI